MYSPGVTCSGTPKVMASSVPGIIGNSKLMPPTMLSRCAPDTEEYKFLPPIVSDWPAAIKAGTKVTSGSDDLMKVK